MRRALLIGIDDYPDAPLSGCVNDAVEIGNLLARHEDGARNFDCKLLTSADETTVTRENIRAEMTRLFASDADIAVFFFAGHGSVRDGAGGAIVAIEGGDGITISEILTQAKRSKVRQKLLILDCCFSGAAARHDLLDGVTVLDEDTLILTACRSSELASEADGNGLFSSLVRDALAGGAADVRGHVTAAAVYSFVDSVLTAWDQRPLLKANVSRMPPLRRCAPRVPDDDLRKLPQIFPGPDYELPLDPSFEPESGVEERNPRNEAIFGTLQRLRDAGLLKPVGAQHLYHAAMQSQRCALTAHGRYFWSLVHEGRM